MPWKVVEYQNATGDEIVARVPPNGTMDLVSGSQLIVQEGQYATFFHDGKPADGFRAGRYSLSTQNLPILGQLLKIATLGRSPFRSYVYFVALKTFTDLGWGTPQPVLFRDKEFRNVNLRAHGSFAVRVSNPKILMRTLVGTQGVETTYAVEEYFRKIIVSRFTQSVPEVLTTIVDLPQHYSELASRVRKKTHDDFDQYGLELVDLLIESITLPPEVQQAIDRAAGARAVGEDELGRYERVARADALRDASKQPGGAADGLTAGLGIGAGLGMAKEMMQDLGPQQAQRPAQQPASAQPAGGGVEAVRAKLRDLKGLLDDGLITQEDFDAQKKRLLEKL
ncbi:MAG: SPFH domain-containing protein [Sedimentisphaerales bacterium]|nr:SPFH domain-containing protein [Sedimentisphaerales bacterium]